jgi:hypothetical protein
MDHSVCSGGEQNWTAEGETSRGMRRLQLGGDMRLIVEHDDACVEALSAKHGIRAYSPETRAPRRQPFRLPA